MCALIDKQLWDAAQFTQMGGTSQIRRAYGAYHRVEDRLLCKMSPVVLHPGFATIVTLLIIFSGGLFGIYPEEIKSTFPFHLFAHGPIVWPAVAAWVTALLAAIGFFVRQRADDTKREESQRQLVDQATKLEELVRTLPPAKFLDAFALLHGACDDTTSDILSSAPLDREQIDRASRVILRAIATLAKIFDGDLDGVRYAANVMIYKDSKSLGEAERQGISKRLRFCHEGVGIDKLAGVLDLEPSLSVSTDDLTNTHPPDGKLDRIALPIPAKEMNGERYNVLPGAPLAFVKHEPDIHTNFDKLVEWCHKNGNFSPSVKEELSSYLGSQREHMQSFLSIPLITRAEVPSTVGILNVHCNRVGMLHDRDQSVAQFVTVVKPLQLLLIKLLVARPNAGVANAAGA